MESMERQPDGSSESNFDAGEALRAEVVALVRAGYGDDPYVKKRIAELVEIDESFDLLMQTLGTFDPNLTIEEADRLIDDTRS